MTSNVTLLDDLRPHDAEFQKCMNCGKTQISVHKSDIVREWWQCTYCGEIAARAADNGGAEPAP